jgi:hypothetical protein
MKYILIFLVAISSGLVVFSQTVKGAVKDNFIREVVNIPDSTPASKLAKRAEAFLKTEKPNYEITFESGSTSKVTAKIVNIYDKAVQDDGLNSFEGKFEMDLTIEFKDMKYRYTFSNIRHVAKKAIFSGGDVYKIVPECGSMKMSSQSWKTICGTAKIRAQQLGVDLKSALMKEPPYVNDAEW